MSDGDILRDRAAAKSPLQKAEEEVAYLRSLKTRHEIVEMTKEGILQAYWLEFLRWVKRWNTDARGGIEYEKDATEINFWHWYIKNKLEDK